MNRLVLNVRLAGMIMVAVLPLLSSTGCAPRNNPFVDDLEQRAPVTTASAEGVREADKVGAEVSSDYALKTTDVADGTVTHGPLYFRTPCCYCGDGAFALSCRDFRYVLCGPLHFHLDAVFLPVKAILVRPWKEVSSDGGTGRS